MRKIFELEDRFHTGEPTIQLVMTSDGRGGRLLEKRAFDSAASSPAYEYLKTVTPKDGHSIVLVNALGAYEAYDDNRNGDSFPNRPVHVGTPVKCGHKGCEAPAWISTDEVLSQHYKSFEKHGGIYKHHVNKDPSKSLGKVLKAVWNDKMQRVELLLEIVNDRDKELAKKIGDGEYPAVSMGCHVKYDVCSICGHRAPTRKDYCDHARNKMRQILSNGEKVCVHNPSPRFFDISFVFRPADPTGFMLKKVASAYDLWAGPSAKVGEIAEQYEQKIADAKKLGDIRKLLLGQVAASRRDNEVAKYKSTARQNAKSRKTPSDKDISKLSEYPLSVVASTFAAKNAALSSSDIARIMLKQAGFNTPDWLVDRVVAIQPILEGVFAYDPSIPEKLAHVVNVSDQCVAAELFPVVDAWSEKYAGMSDYVQSEAYGPSSYSLPVGPGALYRASQPALGDVLTMTDPYTGHVYQTTRGAAQAQHNEDMRHRLAGTALATALYGLGMFGAVRGIRQGVPRAIESVKGFVRERFPEIPAAVKSIREFGHRHGPEKPLVSRVPERYAQPIQQLGGAVKEDVAKLSPIARAAPLVVGLGAAGYLGDKTYKAVTEGLSPLRNEAYITDQGLEVPGNTEFAKMSGLTAPAYLDKVAFDVIERVGDVAEPLRALTLKVASQNNRSAISQLLMAELTDSDKVAALCSGIADERDPVRPPEVNLRALTGRIGAILLS
jgi:hypothetical protein